MRPEARAGFESQTKGLEFITAAALAIRPAWRYRLAP